MIYFSDMGRAAVRKYSWDSRKCEAAAAVDQKPNSIGLTPGGEYLFVSCRGPNNPEGYTLRSPRNGSLYLIRTEDFSILKTWTAGNQPTGLAISPDGRMLASTDFQDRRLNLYLIAR
jgi:sugar lactone lactonase YvrE